MVGWEKPVTRYNKNNNNKNNNKNLHCHMHKDTYAGDREWLNEEERDEEFEVSEVAPLQPLSC